MQRVRILRIIDYVTFQPPLTLSHFREPHIMPNTRLDRTQSNERSRQRRHLVGVGLQRHGWWLGDLCEPREPVLCDVQLGRLGQPASSAVLGAPRQLRPAW